MGLFRRATELGAVPRLVRAVTAIQRHRQGVIIVTSNGDRTRCLKVLIAAGPWTRPLARQVGVDLPLTVERHVVAVFRWAPPEPVAAHAYVAAGYFRPDGREQYLVGSLHPASQADPDRFAEKAAEEKIHALAEPVLRRVPHLARSEVQGGWASLCDVSPGWQPVIGEIAPEVFVDAGTSGHGFELAPALGRHVADVLTGEATEPELEDFDPVRFEQGRNLAAGFGQSRILG